jgi:hypothetical protein
MRRGGQLASKQSNNRMGVVLCVILHVVVASLVAALWLVPRLEINESWKLFLLIDTVSMPKCRFYLPPRLEMAYNFIPFFFPIQQVI